MAVALLTLSACSMTLSPAADLPRYEPLDECFVELPTDFEIDVDIDCGYVLVPEFYTDESSREVKVGVTRLNARQDSGKAPLLMLAGGPGQTEVQPALFELFQPALLGNILDERDIVLVEQRGTNIQTRFWTVLHTSRCPGRSTNRGWMQTQPLRWNGRLCSRVAMRFGRKASTLTPTIA